MERVVKGVTGEREGWSMGVERVKKGVRVRGRGGRAWGCRDWRSLRVREKGRGYRFSTRVGGEVE